MLEETAALQARNEELSDLNAQIARSIEGSVDLLPGSSSSSSSQQHGVQPSTAGSTTSFASSQTRHGPGINTSSTVTLVGGKAKSASDLGHSSPPENGLPVSVVAPWTVAHDINDTTQTRQPTPLKSTANAVNNNNNNNQDTLRGIFKWSKAGKNDLSSSVSSINGSGGAPYQKATQVRERHVFTQLPLLRVSRCDYCSDKMWGTQARCQSEFIFSFF